MNPDQSPVKLAICYSQLILSSKHGSFEISPSDNEGKIWIGRGDGESAEFDAGKLFEVIEKFYKENF